MGNPDKVWSYANHCNTVIQLVEYTSMFAVISISKKQFIASPGDIIDVAHIDGKEGDTVSIDGVLLFHDGKKTTLGKPFIKNLSVKAEIVSQKKGEKINVRRYKHKVRYRKSTGFHALLTGVKIVSIG